ncbi:lysosome membrane protein 2 [Microcaecilia unicolor]|uniref:Lysosome membrane protein 2 n=1 Tax=Microcaecilia unicolor TaxID=1415580 RepID=A0A6P7X1T6_9AMPH|nr:lysosome membrane protein 2 [Microcaecilia unicolor]
MAQGKCCVYTTGALAVLLLIVSIILLVANVFQSAVERKVQQDIVLKNATDTFEVWESPPAPIYVQFYFFNLTNPLEVLAGERPIVEEIGPYTYREYRQRTDIQFLVNTTSVSALNPRTYVFEQEKSVGDPHVDLIRTVNVPAVAVMEMAKANFWLRTFVEAILKTYQEGFFVTRSVQELLWGYKDELLTYVHTVKRDVDPVFGFYYKKNGTDDGEYVYLSGIDNYFDFARIVKWQGNETLHWWTSDTCNMINGTDGTSFHPLISKEETLYMFVSDLCRSIYITYQSSQSVKGITAYRFVPPSKLFANVTINPDNAGFCVPAGNCLGTGILNVSTCMQGVPILLSNPHFYQAEDKYIHDIEGMHPNQEDHESFIDINPLSGVIVRAAKRLQVNVYVRQIPEFTIPEKIRTMVFPVMYVNETVLIDDESAEKLRSILLKTSVVSNIPFMIMVLGIVFGVIFIVLACRKQPAKEEEGTADERASLIRTS